MSGADAMEHNHAVQIAQLVNLRNQLVVQYDAESVLKSAGNYLYELSDRNEVIACVELKRVQWYQFEIDHLSVASAAEHKGFARKLLACAEKRATKTGGRVLQCTIRANNTRSQDLFRQNGFLQVSRFFYPQSGNNLGVWQKVISPASPIYSSG